MPVYMTAPSGERVPMVLTPEQASILYDLVQANSALIESRWSHGICHGLLDSLGWIHTAGGAYVGSQRNPLSAPDN